MPAEIPKSVPDFPSGQYQPRWFHFLELGVQRLHDLLKLRQDVFVVEQKCAFGEIDGRDPAGRHLLIFDRAETVVGCCRVIPPQPLRQIAPVEEDDHVASIGRVVVARQTRGTGIGHLLMKAAVRFCREQFPQQTLHVAAQAHLEEFYAQHGFAVIGSPYDEDGIPHVTMIMKTVTATDEVPPDDTDRD